MIVMLKLKEWQFYVLLAFTIIWSATLPATIKILLNGVSAEELVFFDYLFGFLVISGILVFKKEVNLIKEEFSWWPQLSLIAFFGLFLNRFLYINAFNYIQATEANILYYVYPLVLGLLGFFTLKEKISKHKTIGLLLGFIGAGIVITKMDVSLLGTNLTGDILAILGGSAYGLYLVFSKKLKISSMALIFYTTLITMVISGLYLLLFSKLSVPSAGYMAGLAYIGATEVILLLIFVELLRIRNTAEIANYFYAIPFIAIVFNHFILNDIIHVSYIMGLIVLIAGIIIHKRGDSDGKPV